jgi:transcriptional regulator with XRE-family HTH domain
MKPDTVGTKAMLIEPASDKSVGAMLREWRGRRRLSQLELAGDAEISTRHLSFIETSRARPSREVIARLSDCLDIPIGERNSLLLAAGFAPVYTAIPLDAPAMQPISAILQAILETIAPAIIVDRYWNLVDMNRSVELLIRGTANHLLAAPANALRIAIHPEGMAPRIRNYAEWRDHLLDRLRREARATGDPKLLELLSELGELSEDDNDGDERRPQLAVPLRLLHEGQELEFISTIATFGTPVDVTVSQLMIETFYPANQAARTVLANHAERA